MPSSTGKGRTPRLYLEIKVTNRYGETVYKAKNRELTKGIEDLKTIALEKGDS